VDAASAGDAVPGLRQGRLVNFVQRHKYLHPDNTTFATAVVPLQSKSATSKQIVFTQYSDSATFREWTPGRHRFELFAETPDNKAPGVMGATTFPISALHNARWKIGASIYLSDANAGTPSPSRVVIARNANLGTAPLPRLQPLM
jgi:hypothetical protein